MTRKTKADSIREWFSGRPDPGCTADCADCAAAVGATRDYVWIIMRHERTVDQRRAYYAAYHRERYENDPAYRERKRISANLQKKTNTPAEA